MECSCQMALRAGARCAATPSTPLSPTHVTCATAPQEVAIFSALANFTHHGMIYVPIGYRCTLAPVMTSAAANAIRTDVCSCQCHPHSLIARSCQPLLTNMDEIHGGSPWGAGAFPLSLFTFSLRCCLQPSAMMVRQNAGHSHSFRHIFQRHGRSHAQSD